jgi:hypothetical protein
MIQSPHISPLKSTTAILFISIILSACSIFGAGGEAATPTPEPTSSIADLQVMVSPACLVAQLGMIRVNEPQGDLIAWSPVSDMLAFIASTASSSWNVGELDSLSPPSFDDPTRLANGAAGELTWSPDGSTIAYLGLRRSDNLYTIGLAYPDERTSRDLFPDTAARTDDYSSQKAILGWIDDDRLKLLTSCGLDCLQTIDIDVQTGYSTPVGGPFQRAWDTWAPHTYQPDDIPSLYASLGGQQNWSHDEKHIAYIDEAGNTWVVNVDNNTLYPLDIGQYGTATETDWSYDDRYLAVQVDQNLMVFSFNCP